MNHFPYSVRERRPLTEEEQNLLLALTLQVAPTRVGEVKDLEVWARCGCGKCPTIMFHDEPEKKGSERIIADFIGGDESSGLIGIVLWERDGELSEMEAWSLDGKDLIAWPPIATLRPFEAANSE